MDASTSYTVLRIKRKRTDLPLSSLVIQDQDGPSHPSSSGFGTPKRARNVSYRPKPRGVFKLADTVPDSWIGRGAEGEVLHERIKGLMGTRLNQSISSGNVEGKGKVKEVDATPETQVNEEEMINEPTLPPPPPPPVEVPRPATPPSAPGMQYRVINPMAGMIPSSISRRRTQNAGGGPSLPPVVRSYADVQAEEEARSLFRFIDAQAVSSGMETQPLPQALPEEVQDPQMAAFQNMLDEYLTLERSEAAKKEAEEEYVYDLYYRDVRDSSIALGMRAGDGTSATAIGALIGYSDLSPPSTPSSSEPEDEADEDSNDEDYYRNDYPEDEDADEDMEGYDDPFASSDEGSGSGGGGKGSGSSDDDGEGGGGGSGGKWGYR